MRLSLGVNDRHLVAWIESRRVLVLGTTEHQVRVLAELDAEELGEVSLDEGDADPDHVADPEQVAPLRLVPGRHAAPAATGTLAGSVLSPHTWRQALQAVSGRAS